MAEYARRNGCTAENQLPAQGQVTGWHYTGCNQNADVIFYTIADGGHSWPGGDPLPEFIVGKTSQEIDATRAMWQFFQGHPLINQ
jgi:polyhydroxybutyrate depolymerase